MSKFFVFTFGCRCNQADSAMMREDLCRNSMVEADSHQDAELVVVNTCTVTHRTDQQVRQMVRKLHRDNPKARLVVTGCYAERDPNALAEIPGVNLVVGNADKDRLGEVLQDEPSNPWGKIVRTPLDADRDYLVSPMSRTGGKTRPFVKIQDGCDARCSYCIIPAVRGPGRSARPENILAEIRNLVGLGYQEVVMTGIHLGTYGLKLEGRPQLVGVLREILETPGLGRLRVSSIEPMHFSRAIVDLAAESKVLARHFHIPVQSGSDRILRKMRRPYTASRFLELMGYIQKRLPAAGLGTDIIVGFPGETDGDFEETCSLVREAPLTYLHVFPFSAREGTDAYSMPEAMSPSVIHERARVLRELSQQKNLAFRRRFLGQWLPALSLAKEEGMGDSVVLTDNYIHVRIGGLRVPPNRLLHVRLDAVQPEMTSGSLLA